MKVLHLSTFDIEGGAARAAFRLHRSLVSSDVDSRMLVRSKTGDDPLVTGTDNPCGQFLQKFRGRFDELPALLSRKSKGAIFSSAIIPERIVSRISEMSPDIINLHWINGGYIKLENLARIPYPIVWTLHDMWSFTGGCHYSGECARYENTCGCCPELSSTRENDLSRWNWLRKKRAWKDIPFHIVTPSQWLKECAAGSALFSGSDIRVIPYGFDISVYSPKDKMIARERLGIPPDRKIILFGATTATSDPRKGFQYLIPALKSLAVSGWGEKIELVVYGSNEPENPPDFGMKARYMGHIKDEETVASLNSAADVFVAPSLQDNLPNTVMEALACGTPVVAFHIGGMPDMIDQGVTGWLAKPFDPDDLAQGIIYVIEDSDKQREMELRAREKVEREYAADVSARRYTRLYEEILSAKNKPPM